MFCACDEVPIDPRETPGHEPNGKPEFGKTIRAGFRERWSACEVESAKQIAGVLLYVKLFGAGDKIRTVQRSRCLATGLCLR